MAAPRRRQGLLWACSAPVFVSLGVGVSGAEAGQILETRCRLLSGVTVPKPKRERRRNEDFGIIEMRFWASRVGFRLVRLEKCVAAHELGRVDFFL